MARLAECTQDRASAPAKTSSVAAAPASKAALTRYKAWHLVSPAIHPKPQRTAQLRPRPRSTPCKLCTERWQQSPAKLTLADLEDDPELAQTQIQLIYDTEIVTQQVCGTPAGDDALLLRIAQVPNQVEEE